MANKLNADAITDICTKYDKILQPTFPKGHTGHVKTLYTKNNGIQVEVTTISAPASDAMKMFVVERMPRLIMIDIMTREFPSVPKKIASMLAIDNPMTAVKLGLLPDW